MKILLDECLPKRLKSFLSEFEVFTASEMGWKSLKNSALLMAAEKKKFEVFLTVDKKLKFQQNVSSYDMTIIVFDVRRNKIEEIVPLLKQFRQQASKFEKGKLYTIK